MESFLERMGFFCKVCNHFFRLLEHGSADPKTQRWEFVNGEDTLVELVITCPACHEARGYNPAEVTLEDPDERREMRLPSSH